MALIDKLERWVAIAETCSDKRTAAIVADMRDMIEQLSSEQAAGVELLANIQLDRINQDWDNQVKRDLSDARTRLQEPQEIQREHEMAECP